MWYEGIYAWMFRCMHTHRCIHMETRAEHWCLPPVIFYLIVLRKNPSLNRSFTFQLGWLANELPGSSCLYPLTSVLQVHSHGLLSCGCWGSSSGSHAYKASILPSESSPQSPKCFLYNIFQATDIEEFSFKILVKENHWLHKCRPPRKIVALWYFDCHENLRMLVVSQ